MRCGAVIALAMACGVSQQAAAGNAVAETLLQTTRSWDGMQYPSYPAGQPQISVLRIYIPPHSTLAWHHHTVINAAYVVSGELTVKKKDGGLTKLLHAGEVLPEMVGGVHQGYTGDQSALLVVFYAGVEGKPITVVEGP
jgi:quercetin dioxygenase-like cupin family protein